MVYTLTVNLVDNNTRGLRRVSVWVCMPVITLAACVRAWVSVHETVGLTETGENDAAGQHKVTVQRCHLEGHRLLF